MDRTVVADELAFGKIASVERCEFDGTLTEADGEETPTGSHLIYQYEVEILGVGAELSTEVLGTTAIIVVEEFEDPPFMDEWADGKIIGYPVGMFDAEVTETAAQALKDACPAFSSQAQMASPLRLPFQDAVRVDRDFAVEAYMVLGADTDGAPVVVATSPTNDLAITWQDGFTLPAP